MTSTRTRRSDSTTALSGDVVPGSGRVRRATMTADDTSIGRTDGAPMQPSSRRPTDSSPRRPHAPAVVILAVGGAAPCWRGPVRRTFAARRARATLLPRRGAAPALVDPALADGAGHGGDRSTGPNTSAIVGPRNGSRGPAPGRPLLRRSRTPASAGAGTPIALRVRHCRARARRSTVCRGSPRGNAQQAVAGRPTPTSTPRSASARHSGAGRRWPKGTVLVLLLLAETATSLRRLLGDSSTACPSGTAQPRQPAGLAALTGPAGGQHQPGHRQRRPRERVEHPHLDAPPARHRHHRPRVRDQVDQPRPRPRPAAAACR